MLGVQEFNWEQKEYVLFNVMSNMVKQFDNPTQKQYMIGLAAWLRFEARLIAQLPEEARGKVQVEFDKLVVGYEELLEVKTK